MAYIIVQGKRGKRIATYNTDHWSMISRDMSTEDARALLAGDIFRNVALIDREDNELDTLLFGDQFDSFATDDGKHHWHWTIDPRYSLAIVRHGRFSNLFDVSLVTWRDNHMTLLTEVHEHSEDVTGNSIMLFVRDIGDGRPLMDSWNDRIR